MMEKKKFVKKILISVVILGVLFGLVFIFYINQSKFGELSIKAVDIYLPSLIKTNVDSNYAGEIIDYNNKIPGCDAYGNRTIILRLDDVKAWQYYNLTVNMTSLILSKNMTVTMAVIPKDIEKDTKLFLPWINNIKNDPKVEIALHGYLHEKSEFKDLNKTEATYRLEKGKELLYNYTGVVPVTFISPENEYSDDTIDALSDEGFRVIGAGKSVNIPQYYEIGKNLSYIGYTAETYDFSSSKFIPADKVLEDCNSSLDKKGLCVIMIHPQDYLTTDIKQIDKERYTEFVKLLDGLENLNASFKNFKDVADCRP